MPGRSQSHVHESLQRPLARSTLLRIASERGGFLLEALVGILIFTLGVLGLFALQARAIGYTSDAQYRGEAAYLANAYICEDVGDPAPTLPRATTTSGEAEYDAFAGRDLRSDCPARPAFATNPVGHDHAAGGLAACRMRAATAPASRSPTTARW